MSRVLQIYYSGFDAVFLKLPEDVRHRIEDKLDEGGRQLGHFRHYRMTGSPYCRLRVGDYRIVYAFDIARNELHLLAVGHRRDIYRTP